jgi:two-component system chemotaxis sensor kinase CheA
MSYGADTDKEFIAQAMPAFISEAAEQIEAIETLLLELEEQPDNRDLLDSLFRCAHTVKGSAGIFGLNRVVEFTHHVETLLDKMRDGAIALNPDISTLLLQCNDQIKFLVDTAADESADTPEQKDTRAELVVQLRALTEGPAPAVVASAAPTAALGATATTGPRVWNISARFGMETFRNGMDPLSIARYLSGMGRVVSVRSGVDTVPALVNLSV